MEKTIKESGGMKKLTTRLWNYRVQLTEELACGAKYIVTGTGIGKSGTKLKGILVNHTEEDKNRIERELYEIKKLIDDVVKFKNKK